MNHLIFYSSLLDKIPNLGLKLNLRSQLSHYTNMAFKHAQLKCVTYFNSDQITWPFVVCSEEVTVYNMRAVM